MTRKKTLNFNKITNGKNNSNKTDIENLNKHKKISSLKLVAARLQEMNSDQKKP